jgi:hypothetical protein
MSDPQPVNDPSVNPMTANSIAWTKPENWDGDNYLGPGLPPWGTRNRCPVVRNNRRCRKACIPGGTVCNTHGGAAPQVRNRAKLRLLSLVDPALSTLARNMVDGNASLELKTKIAFGILDRTGLGKAQEVSADVAKAVLMERYHALRENLEKERLEAGMPPIDEEWNVYADGEQPALSEDEPDSDQLFDLDLPAPAAGDEISTGAASALAIDAPQPAAVELDLNHLPGDDPEPASPNTDQGAPA